MILLLVPLIGICLIALDSNFGLSIDNVRVKRIGLSTSVLNLILSLILYILFDFSGKQFQFIEQQYQINFFDIYVGVDGISIYFVLLTTIIMPIALLSNWSSIQTKNVLSFVVIILLLETLLLGVFLVLDILLFYIFFESILPPLFLLIGIYGSSNKVRASFYLFLYTLLGSLFMLLAIVTMASIMGTTDYDALYKTNFSYRTQLFLFYGIFFAFAVKTPTIFLNNWLLKAHVESPLSGSIILAGMWTMLALKIAKCWKNLFRSISRNLITVISNIEVILKYSFILENICYINKKPIKFFRDHALEATICYNINIHNKNLGSYLAGLIEGDGCIYVPKSTKSASIISIAFNSKDLPLALKIQSVLSIGNLYKMKGKNCYSLSISSIQGLKIIVSLINGNMRTPKIKQLYKLINRINEKLNCGLNKLPVDKSDLGSNAWLSGFLDADGCFYVRNSQNKHTKTKKIACMLELAQKRFAVNNEDMLDIMRAISEFLLTKLKFRSKSNQYWIRTTNIESNLKLIDYLTKYPLFSSKYLDYMDWNKIIQLKINKKYKNNLDLVLKYKNGMNSKRSFFVWNHLNRFYSCC